MSGADDAFLSFWSGRITTLALALYDARSPALPPAVLRNVEEAYFACNRAANAIENERRNLEKPRSARRKKKA